MRFDLDSVLAHRAQTQARSPNAALVTMERGPNGQFNRSDSTVVVPAQKRNDAILHFFGAKAGEALAGFGLGYVVGMGEPMFMTDPADPSSGFGLIPVVAVASNLFELVMLWTGWTPSKKIGGAGGIFVDGLARGVAGASNGVFWYNQGNMLALAKGGPGTPGVSTLGASPGLYDHPQMGVGAPQAGYAPAPQADHPQPLYAPKVQAARTVANDPHSFFF